MTRIITTFFFSGYLKPAPGTWGSAAAVIAALVLHPLGGPVLLLVSSVAAYFIGLWAVKIETAGQDNHDPSEIVIDEVVGQWIALLPTSVGAWMMGLPLLSLWPGIVTAFVMFRLFDIWKPGLIGRADRRDDATGVMLDDVWAGVHAAVATGLLAAVSHLVVMRLI